MSAINYNNAVVLLGGYDLSAQYKELTVNHVVELLDVTTFGNAGRARAGGLKTPDLAGSGFLNLTSSGIDAVLFAAIGVQNTVITAFSTGPTAGSTGPGSGYGFQAVDAKHTIGGQVGTALPFAVTGQGGNGLPLIRAFVLVDDRATVISTGTTNGSFFQFPTNTTCESLYGGFHITAISTGAGLNGSLQAVIQQASSSAGTGVTSRGTFTAQTCKGGYWLTPVASASLSTDQPFWRVQLIQSTGTSTGATSNALVWMGIQ